MWKPQESDLWYQPTRLRSWAVTGASMMRYHPVCPGVFLHEPLLLSSRVFLFVCFSWNINASSSYMGIKAGLVAVLLSFASCISRRTLFRKINDQIGLKFCSLFSIVGNIFLTETVHVSLLSLIYILETTFMIYSPIFFDLPYCLIFLTSLQFNS